MVAAHALAVIAETSILLLLVYGPWQDFCTARARQNMFILRARLFDFASSGKISFDDDAYRLSRLQVERLIRFAHQLTWIRVLFSMPVLYRVRGESRVQTVIAMHPDLDVRTELQSILSKVSTELLWMLVYKSPPVLALVFLTIGLSTALQTTGMAGVLAAKAWARKQSVQQGVLRAIWREADYLKI